MVICPDCGKEVPQAKFCKNCGARLPEVEEATQIVNEDVNSVVEEVKPVVVEETIPVSASEVTEEEVKQEETRNNIRFCPNCGYELNGEFKFCPDCGANLTNPSGTTQTTSVTSYKEKNILIAIILSVIFPGLGQFYLGLNHKGLMFLIGYILSFVLFISIILLFIGAILMFVVWIWALIDTIISTNALNRGESVEDKLLG